MKNLKAIFVFTLLFSSINSRSQLSGHIADMGWGVGFHAGFASLKCDNILYEEAQKVGPYFGLGMDLVYSTFTAWEVRYYLEAKWTMDLFHKGIELIKGTGTDARIDFTGFTWHKLGINVFATDNICVGVGGSFADYIVDVPLFVNNNGDFSGGYTWQEPSGWNWTAGPCLFLDAGVGDFAASLITSYDFTYFTPKVTDDYEAATKKIDGYKAPHFMYFDLTVNHESGVYISFNRTKLIDQGTLKNHVSRAEFKAGWKWWI